ncbi:hypothetical protein [Alkalimarinus sediminis]|uniref:Uncharacterized protein n=1 Tax=Alkalimarinus sediminis TaxID=1632866 RepID=A0A9E8KND4_9ALTE|nr:hypothetical protein [Alkalimarinus sediminis]UZW74243.1 hypothetical protein NNL22_14620 [Alkalimarinus sediminis]
MAYFFSGITSWYLDEAAKKLGCSKDKLLEYGASGNLQLCVKVPDDLSVWSMVDPASGTAVHGADFFSEKVMDRLPEERQNVTFLSLSESDCLALGTPGYQEQRVFYSGYAEREFGMVTHDTPHFKRLRPYPSEALAQAARIFVLYPNDSPPPERGTSLSKVKRINLKADEIFIADIELQRALSALDDLKPLPIDKFTQHTNTSEKLRLLNLVAREQWRESDVGKNEFPSLNEFRIAIVKKFKDNDVKPSGRSTNKQYAPYSEKLIGCAARMISPEFSGAKKNTYEDQLYLTDNLRLLIEASKIFWEGVKLGDSSEYPDTKEIHEWFLADERLAPMESDKMTEVAATIIRPEGASKGRQKN